MKKQILSRWLLTMLFSSVLVLALTSTAYATWVNINSTPANSCAPTQGHFSWNQSNTNSIVSWYQYEYWTGSRWNCLQSGTFQYHLETEAYNPANGGSSCDRLNLQTVVSSLPLYGPIGAGNGCGSSTYSEEAKVYFIKGQISQGTNYYVRTDYWKVNASPGQYEVNWSFSQLLSDWWMAKIRYNISNATPYANYTPSCSSPSGILTGYSGCP